MANEAIITGDAGLLYAWDGAAWLPIGCLTSYTLNTTTSEKTRTTKCNPGVVEKAPGVFDYSIDLEGLYLNTVGTNPDNTLASHDWLLEQQLAGTGFDWWIDSGDGGDAKQYYGSAFISSLSLTQGSGEDDSSFSGTLSGDGTITNTDPHAT